MKCETEWNRKKLPKGEKNLAKQNQLTIIWLPVIQLSYGIKMQMIILLVIWTLLIIFRFIHERVINLFVSFDICVSYPCMLEYREIYHFNTLILTKSVKQGRKLIHCWPRFRVFPAVESCWSTSSSYFKDFKGRIKY